MNGSHIVQKVDKDRWQQAQEFELKFARQTIESDDDWNQWWYEKFEQYAALKANTLTTFWRLVAAHIQTLDISCQRSLLISSTSKIR